MRVFLFTDGSLKGDGRLRNFPSMADFFDADVHAAGQFFAGRLAAKFLYKLPGMPGELVDDLDHVDRNADRAFEREQTAVTRQCHSAQRDARATKLSARLGGDWVCQTPQAANLAFQSLEALDEGPEVVHEALAFVPMERNLADGERNVDARAGQRPLAANVGLLLRFWRSGEFLCLAEGGFME